MRIVIHWDGGGGGGLEPWLLHVMPDVADNAVMQGLGHEVTSTALEPPPHAH